MNEIEIDVMKTALTGSKCSKKDAEKSIRNLITKLSNEAEEFGQLDHVTRGDLIRLMSYFQPTTNKKTVEGWSRAAVPKNTKDKYDVTCYKVEDGNRWISTKKYIISTPTDEAPGAYLADGTPGFEKHWTAPMENVKKLMDADKKYHKVDLVKDIIDGARYCNDGKDETLEIEGIVFDYKLIKKLVIDLPHTGVMKISYGENTLEPVRFEFGDKTKVLIAPMRQK